MAWQLWCPCNNHSLLVRPPTPSWWCSPNNSRPSRPWWWSNPRHRPRLLTWLNPLEAQLLCTAKDTVATTKWATLTAMALRKWRCQWLRPSTTEAQPCSVAREPGPKVVPRERWSVALRARTTTWTTSDEWITQLLQLHLQLRIYEQLILHQPLPPLIMQVTDSK
jgi:hypothetical protein